MAVAPSCRTSRSTSAATDFSSQISTALATNPDALVVISFDQIKTIAQQLATNNFDFKKFYGSDGNYGVIDPSYTNADIAGAQFTNPGVNVVGCLQDEARQVRTAAAGDKALTAYSYAPESYDAVVLLALAALQGGKVDGTTLKKNLQSVSEDGTKCTTFDGLRQADQRRQGHQLRRSLRSDHVRRER